MQRQLKRSLNDKKLFGVCAGLGNYLNVDPSIVRLITVCAVLCGGVGVFVYFIAALIMPRGEYGDEEYSGPRLCRARYDAKIFGVCQGLANYFPVDVTVLRIILLILAFSGIGLIFYIIAGIVLPIDNPS